jgi:hypothetical protein
MGIEKYLSPKDIESMTERNLKNCQIHFLGRLGQSSFQYFNKIANTFFALFVGRL